MDRQQVILRGALLLAGCALGGCGVGKVPPIERYHLQGVVQTIDPQAHTATVKHQKITGFMGAMTMEFPVRDPKEFAALRSGETVTATVFVQDTNFWIGEIKETK